MCRKELLDFVFPRRCVVCSRQLDVGEKGLCEECLSDIPYTYFWSVELNRMSEKMNLLIEKELITNNSTGYTPFSQACALMFYHPDSRYRDIPMQLKYFRDFSIGELFGLQLGAKMRLCSRYADVDCIIPVPLHFLRRLKRGYNQAEILARGIAKGLNVPQDTVHTKFLKRRRRTRTQTRLSFAEKLKNVSQSFALTASEADLSQFQHILLVDDVCTTGATMFECYKVLRGAFCGKISFASLAYFES